MGSIRERDGLRMADLKFGHYMGGERTTSEVGRYKSAHYRENATASPAASIEGRTEFDDASASAFDRNRERKCSGYI
jgi:hypothetical protein